MKRVQRLVALPSLLMVAYVLIIATIGCDDLDKATQPKAPVHELLLENALWPSWSPDGSELVFNRFASSGGNMEIWRLPLTGGEADTLIADPTGTWPMWLPDGQRIVYYRWSDESSDGFVVYDVSTEESTFWEAPDVWDDVGFNLSPDGSEVLYTRWGAELNVTRALNLTDGSIRHVVDGTAGAISPDGQWIAYGTQEDTLAIAPVGGGDTLLLEMGGAPRWTPDSKYVVFCGFDADDESIDLIAVSRDGTFREQLTDEPELSWYHSVSPQGDKIAYIRSEGEFGPHELWLLDLDLVP
jgi:Tol biopolymer transport system component